VARLAQMLGFQKVGWVFAHPPREDEFIMTAAEVRDGGCCFSCCCFSCFCGGIVAPVLLLAV
jgi:hypothetical protein